MIKIKHSSGSTHSKSSEAHAINNLKRILSKEEGYLIPNVFIGNKTENYEIDAILLLPDIFFFIDFKSWHGQRIVVEGINVPIKRLRRGAWEEDTNTLSNYEIAARIAADVLRRQERQWLPKAPRIHSLLVFTRPPNTIPAQVSFAGGDHNKPMPQDGVGACNIEQLPQLINAFRAASTAKVQLTQAQLSVLANFLLTKTKPQPASGRIRIDNYQIISEHHVDPFLNCTIYTGEGDLLQEQVWIKKYERVFTAPENRDQKDLLTLRHADVLSRFPQHKHIVHYRTHKITDYHLYVILERRAGVFLNELLYSKTLDTTTESELQKFPFTLRVRLQILGDLLCALEYLMQQQGFEQSAYRDLRPDNIFIQLTPTGTVAQLFNFDCTKIHGRHTKQSNMRSGHHRFPQWDTYASPELLEYIDTSQSSPAHFTGGIRSDLFSWGIIAWEMLTGVLPFADTEAKLAGHHPSWTQHHHPPLQTEGEQLSPAAIQLLEACLDRSPAKRPSLAALKSYFPYGQKK